MSKELEALKENYKLYNKLTCDNKTVKDEYFDDHWQYCLNNASIEIALTTKSKKEQAFDIIRTKNIDVKEFKVRFVENQVFDDCYKDDFDYYENSWIAFSNELLDRDEFNLLKEVLRK